jgi:membrane-bound ClpP family serine protease
MTIFIIIFLILIGISLILLEFLVLPGTIIAAVGGFLLLGSGIYLSYSSYGIIYGHISVVAVLISLIISFIIVLRSKTWKKIMLKTEITGVTNTYEKEKINVGDKGITISRLAPMGKVEVNGVVVEAKSINDFIDQNKEITVVKVEQDKLIVKI